MLEAARLSTNVIDLRDAGLTLVQLLPFVLALAGAWLSLRDWRARVGVTLLTWAVIITYTG